MRDIHDVLEVTVYDEDSAHKSEFLGKVSTSAPKRPIRRPHNSKGAEKNCKRPYTSARQKFGQIFPEMSEKGPKVIFKLNGIKDAILDHSGRKTLKRVGNNLPRPGQGQERLPKRGSTSLTTFVLYFKNTLND